MVFVVISCTPMSVEKKIFLFLLSLVFIECSNDDSKDIVYTLVDPQAEFSGGDASINLSDERSFSQPFKTFSIAEQIKFKSGNFLFENVWVEGFSLSSQNLDGLGPFYNARSCTGCHVNDGRGRVPKVGENITGLLFRLHGTNINPITGQNLGDSIYGEQFQNLVVQELDGQFEGRIQVNYTEIKGEYPDGTAYTLRKPQYTTTNLNYGDVTSEISPRIAPVNLGLGLLEAISEEDLLVYADESDTDNDGISGKPNYVWHLESQSKRIGRFGWKLEQPTVKQQVAAAFNGDMGLSTSIFPDDCPTVIDDQCDRLIGIGEAIEVDNDALEKITLYSSGLSVPLRRNFNTTQTNLGEQLFNDVTCIKCHVAKYTTGISNMSPAFENQVIFPYTDLLLHDMGEALSDNAISFDAIGSEWRTPPLWGVGLIPAVNGHQELMHDGRARNVEEAILWHGGEAENSKERFKQLTILERQALIDFVNSL